MKTRRFGRTGHMSTVLILGGFAVGPIDQGEADAVMELAMKYGLTPDYLHLGSNSDDKDTAEVGFREIPSYYYPTYLKVEY